MIVKPAESLQLLFLLCQLFGIASPQPTKKIYKFYVIVLMMLQIAGLLILTLAKMCDPVFEGFAFLVKFFDHAAMVFLTISCTLTPISTIFLKPQQAKKLFDVVIGGGRGRLVKEETSRGLWAIFLFVNVLSLSIVATDSYIWVSSLGMEFYKYYLPRNVEYCIQGLILVVYLWTVTEITRRFSMLNESIGGIRASKYYPHKNKNLGQGTLPILVPEQTYILRKLKEVTKLHNFLCDHVCLISELFGKFMLAYILFSIFFVTQYLMILIIYTVFGDTVDGVQFGIGLQVISGCWIIENIIKIFALAYAGDRIAKEANLTITICYKLLNDMDSQFDSRQLREELDYLKDQITHRQPQLTASGFFVVDFTMIGFIISSITSYIIVSLQFRKN